MHRVKILITIVLVMIFSSAVFAQTYTSPSYSLTEAKIAVSNISADSSSYSLRRVIIGNVFGGKAQSADYVLKIYCAINTSINVSPMDWMLSEISPGEIRINDENTKIILKNVGDEKVSYGLRIVDASGTWEASGIDNTEEINRCSISAAVTDTGVAGLDETYFNESESEDLILEEMQFSTSTKFATTLSASNGVNIMPGEERALWLKFNAPQVDTSQEGEHNLWLIIEAKEVN